jgi:Ca-activated chloride channel family protein
MLAEDVKPSRLERARADLLDLVAALKKKGGHRVGLIAFADHAVLLCPVTTDYGCFEEELARVSLATVRAREGSGAADGTQIGMALRRAAAAINKDAARYTDILLVSDGGDMEEDTLAAADEPAKLGVQVHVVGMGDVNRGALIPVREADGRRGYLTYQGQPVRVNLEEKVLREVTQRTGGRYTAAGTGFLELDRWFDDVIAAKAARELAAEGGKVPIHRFEWFLLPAVVLLLVEAFVGDSRQKPGAAPGTPAYFSMIRRRKRAGITT